MDWLITVMAIIAGVAFVVKSMMKSVQQLKGRNKCTFCGKGLRSRDGVYATTCHHCGQTQPWATEEGKAAIAAKREAKVAKWEDRAARMTAYAEDPQPSKLEVRLEKMTAMHKKMEARRQRRSARKSHNS